MRRVNADPRRPRELLRAATNHASVPERESAARVAWANVRAEVRRSSRRMQKSAIVRGVIGFVLGAELLVGAWFAWKAYRAAREQDELERRWELATQCVALQIGACAEGACSDSTRDSLQLFKDGEARSRSSLRASSRTTDGRVLLASFKDGHVTRSLVILRGDSLATVVPLLQTCYTQLACEVVANESSLCERDGHLHFDLLVGKLAIEGDSTGHERWQGCITLDP